MLQAAILFAIGLGVAAALLAARAMARAIRSADVPARPEPAVVIVPCKGEEPGLGESLRCYAAQDHPRYRLLLVTARADDAAAPAIAAVARGAPHVTHVVAGVHPEYGQKSYNVLAGLARAGSEPLLAFGDSDIAPDPGWLRRLVGPLQGGEAEATTGYRWYAGPRLWDRVTSLWNGFSVVFLLVPSLRFVWGGSYALRREVAAELDLPRLWRGVLSDDLTLTAALRERGKRIAFVPSCVSVSAADFTFAGMVAWATRQLVMTRHYAGRVYLVTLAVSLGSLGLFLWLPWVSVAQALGTGVAVVALGRSLVPQGRPGAPSWAEAPLFALCLIPGVVGSLRALFARTVSWRGVVYRIRSPQAIRVLHDGGAPE